MTKLSSLFNPSAIIILFSIVLFASCKKDDDKIDMSEVDGIYFEVIPGNNAQWVDVNAPVKIVFKKENGTVHIDELGEWSLNNSISVKLGGVKQEFSQTTIKGLDNDTILLDFIYPFSYNSEIEVIVTAELARPDGDGFARKDLSITSSFYTIDSELDFNVIKNVYPDADQASVDISAYPEVEFISVMNQPINNGEYIYRIVLNEFYLIENNNEVTGDIVWNDSDTRASLIPSGILKSATDYKIELSASIQIQNGNNWNAIDTQRYSSEFSTANQQNYILNESDIEYLYPLPNQYNFYIDEYNKGHLKPKYRFGWIEESASDFSVRFTGSDIDTLEIPALYSAYNGFTYNLPQAQLNQNKIYKVEYLRGQSKSVLFSYHFKTSNYRTFTSKIEDFTIHNNGIYQILSNGIDILSLYFTNSIGKTELFDYYESEKEIAFTLYETDLYKQTGLIQIETLLDNAWFNKLDNLMYKPLEDNLYRLTWRSMSDIYGPLQHAASIKNDVEDVLLTTQEIESGVLNPASKGFSSTILHYQSPIVAVDHSNIMSLLINIKDPDYIYTSGEEQFLNTPCPSILADNGSGYQIKIKLNYVLPGIEIITSSKELVLFND